MKIYTLFILLLILLLPNFSYAGTCLSANEVTVIYINGVRAESELSVELDKVAIEKRFKSFYPEHTNIHFKKAYNPSRFLGIGDVATAVLQSAIQSTYMYGPDFVNILEQLHHTVTTDKIVIVGHSQGTFYANSLYQYLVTHGVPAESVAVVNIATPARLVEGNGNYYTSTSDKLINRVRTIQYATQFTGALPGIDEIPLSLTEQLDPYGGHNLRAVYLAHRGDLIIQQIHAAAKSLRSGPPRAACVPAPDHLVIAVTTAQRVTLDTVQELPAMAGAAYVAMGNSIITAARGAYTSVASVANALFATQPHTNVYDIIPSSQLLAASSLDAFASLPAIQSSEMQSVVAPMVAQTPPPPVTPQLTPPSPQTPEVTTFDIRDAFTPTPVVVAPITQPQLVTSTASNPGGLTSLAFGSGAGGGGGATAEPRAEPARPGNLESRLEAAAQQPAATPPPVPTCPDTETLDATTNTCTPKPVVPVVCTLPETRNEASNTCELVIPTCTDTEVLDTSTNTCVPKPVVCTVPEVREVATNTCSLPTQTGPTLLPSEFTSDTILTYAASPYISKPEGAQTITIPAGVTVTAEPGVTLNLASATKINIAGTLSLPGTTTYPITVTALDTTKHWTGITILPTGTLTSTHTTFSYGGWTPTGPLPADWPRAIIHNTGTLTLTNTSLTHSHNTALVHSGGTLTSTNLHIDTATTGLSITAPSYDITTTAISNTTLSAVNLSSLLGKITQTTGTNNTQNGITFTSPTIEHTTTAHLYPNSISYFTDRSLAIHGTLIIHKGAFVQNVSNTYTIHPTGSITTPADETDDNPTFTSLWDNAKQAESRGTIFPNQNRAPRQGDWGGIVTAPADGEGRVGSVDGSIVQKFNK